MKKILLLSFLAGLFAIAGCIKAVDPTLPAAQNTPVPGSIWTEVSRGAAFSARYIHASVVYDNAMWVIGGALSDGSQTDDIWYSMDGVYWQEATPHAAFGPRQGHTCVVFKNEMWVIGGYSNGSYLNDTWRSPNGIDWFPATLNAEFTPRAGHTCVVYDNGAGPKMYVIGGHQGTSFYNDIWYSDNGSAWYPKQIPEFTPRYYHTSLVFSNKIWVIGGVSYSGDYIYNNDVWASPDGGSSWTRVTSPATFNGRHLQESVVYDNKMWVIGGNYNTTSYYNDAWYSANGIDWTAATQNADFPQREGLKAVFFNNAMYLIAGAIADSGFYYNDVWKSQ